MTETTLCESFHWLSPDFKVQPSNKNTIKIKGIALRGNTISKNRRKYVDEELHSAARTFIDCPITVNHQDWRDHKNRIGKVNWMEYDTDGTLEYVGEIWKEPYVSMLRGKSREIKGVSVEADYLRNECPICHKHFYTEEEFQHHMKTQEFKPVSCYEPHGMRGRALSIVAYNEQPGVPGTTIELMETAGEHGILQLLETVIKVNQEKETMTTKQKMNEPSPPYTVGVKETVQEQEHECPEGEHWDEDQQACVANVATEQEAHQCEEGYHWDNEKGECVKDEIQPEQTIEALKLGEPCSPELQACVDKLTADGKSEESAQAICRSQLGETIKLRESIIKPVTYQPITFENFESVLKETKDEIRAAKIIKQSREINEAFKTLTEAVNETITEINKPLAIKLPYIDETWRKQLKQLAEAHRKLVQNLPKDDLSWKKIKPYDDKELREAIAAIPQYNDAELKQKITALEETIKELPVLKETIAQQKKDFDSLLESADKSVKEHFDHVNQEHEADQQKIKELTEKLDQAKEEIKTAKTIAETAKTTADNLDDKQKAAFKAKPKQVIKQANPPSSFNPYK